MSKAKTLAGTVSTGGVLDNPSAIPAANISGTVGSSTNLAGGSNGTIPYQSASGTTQMLAVGTAGQVLQTNGAGAPSWATPASATTATNIAGGSNGTIPYQSAAGTTQMLAAGSSGQFLKSNGVAAPSWAAVAINQSTLVADGAVTAAGKALILTAAGKAKQSVIAAASNGSSTTFNAAQTQMAAVVFDPVAGVFAIIYRDSDTKGKMKIATVASNNTVTFSSAFTFYNTAIYNGSLNACFDPVTSQILIAFTESVNNNAAAITAKITGSNITFGTAVDTGSAGYEVGISYDTNASRFLLAYRTSAQYVRVGTVTGTSISFGSATTVYGSSVNGYGSPAVYCPGIGKHCIGYNTGGRGYIVQITINPSTFAITVGSAAPVTNGTGADGYLSGNHSLAWIESLQRLVVIHSGGPSYNYYLMVTMFSADSTSWNNTAYTIIDTDSYGAPYQYWPSIDYSESSGYVIISYVDSGSARGFLSFSNSLGYSAIGFGTKTQWQSTATDMTGVAISTTNNQALVIAWDNTNPSPAADLNGTCAGAAAPLADQRTSFIGFATASAADGASVTFTTSFGVDTNQTSLTPNTTYYLSSSDGTTLTTTSSGPKVARAISTTSVQVLGPNCA
jgi:hypothetical protein